ncbi:sigma-54-dependent transcriptional regulator [Falsiroseomonas selenitidurans]|uniref:Sigma-54-dependent Fis family transcriptional regulator n=1 Tax=Falsiroseomonas selenitidurans TaxID=2716335 RepID=A0ABX1DX92_9PROT|nr:sigma-54 dependent transcriptional regulator [Falsiroseomonas selenitidurans]NKC29525.1 sigma-54-dependent Fis family transcriptional regulator [Falsiroseomonas selenitidurans]
MAGPAARVLIVEDTPTQAEVARALLRDLGHEIRIAETGGAALEIGLAWRPDAILMDLELPDFSGFETMRRLRAQGVEAAIIVVTVHGSVNHAVEAMREGAVDFIVKPFAKTRLTVTLENALEKRALATELREVKAQLSRDRFFSFIGASPAMQAVYRTIESVAASKANVFITGESGTGKELAADAVHRASPRRARPFVALNCGAIPRDLLESEIFGHVKGAFTGATDTRLGAAKLADGGTLFLDEIGEMPLEMQVKLLRFVQTGAFQPVGASRPEKVDVRIVSATNRDPWAEVEAGRFREDLYYRLYVVPLDLPPLRDRGPDALLIARHFLAAYAQEEGKRFRGFAREAEQALAAYGWPGNVRQLQNVVRNIVVLHDGERVERFMLPPMLLRGAAPRPPPAEPVPPEVTPQPTHGPAPAPPWPAEAALPWPDPAPVAQPPAAAAEPAPPPPLASPWASPWASPGASPGASPWAPPQEAEAFQPLAEIEKRYILAALDHVAQDVPRAAALLGINPSTIYRKLQAWRAQETSAPR